LTCSDSGTVCFDWFAIGGVLLLCYICIEPFFVHALKAITKTPAAATTTTAQHNNTQQ